MMKLPYRFLLAGFLLTLMTLFAASELTAQTSTTESKDKKDPPAKERVKDELELKAEEQFRNSKLDEAYKTYEEAVKKNPLLSPARLWMARMLFAANQPQAGRQYLEIALVEHPTHPEVYLTNASIALAEGRITDALLSCTLALQNSDHDRWTASQRKEFATQSNAGLATAYEARKEWSAARKHLSAWSLLDPKNSQIKQKLARALFYTERFDDAIAELKAAAEADTKMDPPEVTMAILYGSLIGQNPGDPTDPKSLEEAKKKDDKNLEKAEKYYADAIKDHPKAARVYQAYAGWLLDTGKFEEAKNFIGKAENLEPTTRETQALVGLLARYEGRYSAAAKIFEQLVRDQPADFFATNQLALVLIEQGEAEKGRAVQLAEVNARQYQKAAEAYATLGWVYFRMGREGEAEKALGLATNSGQASADTAYYLAKLLDHKAKFKEAAEVLQKAVKSKGVFVNRKAAADFLALVEKKVPKTDSTDKEKEPKGKGPTDKEPKEKGKEPPK